MRNIGEEMGLCYIDGRKTDEYTFAAQSEDKSWGRTADGAGTWKSWSTPTHGSKNQ
jgi:hypothetical protein